MYIILYFTNSLYVTYNFKNNNIEWFTNGNGNQNYNS